MKDDRRASDVGGRQAPGEREPRERQTPSEREARERQTIDDLRRQIDELDERLVRLLNERAGCALDIGRLKQALGMEIYQPEREREVLRHVRETNTGPLDEHAIVRLFERIIDEARRLERLGDEARRLERPPQGSRAKAEG